MSTRHQQVADDLRRRIASGALATGERLPSERLLSAHYRVSTPTLRDALGVLQAEGLVEKVQGRGNFVREPPPRLTYPGRNLGTEGTDLHILVSFAEIVAVGDVAVRLGVPPDAVVTQYVCLTHRGGTPQSLTHLYIPYEASELAAPTSAASPWGDDIVDHLTVRAGVPAVRATHQVTARFPTDAEAQSLRIATRTPVLVIERRVVAERRAVAERRGHVEYAEYAEHAGRPEDEAKGAHALAYSLVVLPGDRARVAFTTPHLDHHLEQHQKGTAR